MNKEGLKVVFWKFKTNKNNFVFEGQKLITQI